MWDDLRISLTVNSVMTVAQWHNYSIVTRTKQDWRDSWPCVVNTEFR
jgi:hypothetical protein